MPHSDEKLKPEIFAIAFSIEFSIKHQTDKARFCRKKRDK
jgi:hypothetical protein